MVALLALAARPVAAAAFEPACAALASATAPALKIDNTPHVFDRVNDYVYVRADVTTSTTLSGLQSIFVWGGGDGGCGVTGAAGMLFGIWDDGLGGKIFLGRQCTSTDGFYVLPLAEFTPTTSAQYVVEMYYRAWTEELRIWVNDVEVTPTGTTYALEWSDGYASAGYGKHYAAETWGGTIHAIDFYECAWPNTPAAAPSPPASVLDSLKVHLVAEDFDAGTWADRISGLSFANADGIAAPTLVTHGAMNGRKALRFGITDAGSASASGVEAPQTTFLSAAGQTGVTVFVVYRPIAYNTTLYFPFLFDMGMLATAGFGFGSEVNALHNFFTVNGAQLYTPTDHGGLIQRSVFESEEKTYVAAIRVKFKTGADDPGYQLAASQDSDVAVGDIFPKVGTSVEKFDSGTIYNTPFSLGIQSKAYDRANRFFRGYLAEFRWYADLLSDADVETIRSELVDAYVEPPTFVVEPQYGLDSLKLHLMADDLDAADGSPAGTWIDRVSGLALSTPSAGIAAPTLVDDAMNGHKALQFGFSSAGVVGATGFEAPVYAYGSFLSHPRQAGVTVFVVFRRDAHDGDASDEEQFLFDAGNGGLNADFSMRANAGDVRVGTPTAHGGKASVSSVSVSAGTTYVAAVRVKFGAAGRETGYQSVTSQDGYLAVGDMYPKEPIAVEGFTADTLDTTHPFSIGIASGSSNGDRTARFFKGSIAEIRYYGDLLSDADARRVQDALVEKYVPAADRSDADPARRATFGHAPTCAPVLDLVPPNNAKANNVVSSHAFVAGTVLYARMDVVWKTPSTWGTPPQTMILLLMGGSGDYSCGGWRLGFSSDERMYMDSQCNGPSGSGFSGYVVADGPFTHGARYVFEYYYDQVSAKAKMWSTCLSSCGEYEVQGALVERTPAGGATPSGGWTTFPELRRRLDLRRIRPTQPRRGKRSWLYGHNILRLAHRVRSTRRPRRDQGALGGGGLQRRRDVGRPDFGLVVYSGYRGADARGRGDERAQGAPVRDHGRRLGERVRGGGAVERARHLRRRRRANRRHGVRGVPPHRVRHDCGRSVCFRLGRLLGFRFRVPVPSERPGRRRRDHVHAQRSRRGETHFPVGDSGSGREDVRCGDSREVQRGHLRPRVPARGVARLGRRRRRHCPDWRNQPRDARRDHRQRQRRPVFVRPHGEERRRSRRSVFQGLRRGVPLVRRPFVGRGRGGGSTRTLRIILFFFRVVAQIRGG